jgi:hypothetical protein
MVTAAALVTWALMALRWGTRSVPVDDDPEPMARR